MDKDGIWRATTKEEIENLIALLVYFGQQNREVLEHKDHISWSLGSEDTVSGPL